ncbi:unnamed protein product [Linum tenue]|uniref:galactinol--sucrose galactosyltransferase n=1 Tax=Linum tenue TaxID=586396 RepID=A0AAV0N9Z4_9ROSI|nr:unnamed protein product [Linum tenue]
MAPSAPKLSAKINDLMESHANQLLNPSPAACAISLDGSTLKSNGHAFLTDVPTNITLTASADKSGAFLGFNAAEPDHRHVSPIGKLKNLRFMSIFRFKVWWTTHWVGSNGRDLEHETQLLLLDTSPTGGPYVLIVPILEGQFRASLQPGQDDDVDVCVESGSTKVKASSFHSVVYVHAGNDPFTLMKEGMGVVRAHLGTFKLLDEKDPPGIVDKFGWCTWDAFYLTVNPQGIWDGVKGLADGGCPPGLVLIDDGWQSISHDEDPVTKEGMNHTVAGEQMPCRLLKFQENYKFRDYASRKAEVTEKGMGAFVRDLKDEFGTVDYVYVWHALCGYWGGIRPNVPGLPESVVVRPKLSPGLEKTMEDLAVDKIVSNGIGLVPPELVDQMYDGIHSHLENAGIDGVKVDVIHLLEMLCENYGGRVDLAKAYFKALTASVNKHFNGNGVIASMEHCNDFMFLGTEAIALGRVGDDFWCTDPSGDPNGTFWLQGCHMVHCAYNSLWMGNFIHPDWDMFQSTHPCAEFHAASRAISGGPIYISDTVGNHNFPLLKRLAMPDGSILRCEYYALPTRDCLFEDPLHDGKTMLKIWNLNKFTGVIGAFNCQGGGWSRETRRNQCFSEFSHKLTAQTNPKDIEWASGKSPMSIEGVQVSLEPFEFELITVSPVTVLAGKSVQFAPIGLVNMLNSGGAIRSVEYRDGLVEMGVKGAGEMVVFASEKPASCKVDGGEVEFKYDGCLVTVEVPWSSAALGVSHVEFLF